MNIAELKVLVHIKTEAGQIQGGEGITEAIQKLTSDSLIVRDGTKQSGYSVSDKGEAFILDIMDVEQPKRITAYRRNNGELVEVSE